MPKIHLIGRKQDIRFECNAVIQDFESKEYRLDLVAFTIRYSFGQLLSSSYRDQKDLYVLRFSDDVPPIPVESGGLFQSCIETVTPRVKGVHA